MPAYDIVPHPDLGILEAVSEGFWSVENAIRFKADFALAAARTRAECGRLLMLVDATRSSVQDMAVIECFKGWETGLCRPGDRYGLIVTSSLAKAQARRAFETPHSQAFMSRDAAILWLSAA